MLDVESPWTAGVLACKRFRFAAVFLVIVVLHVSLLAILILNRGCLTQGQLGDILKVIVHLYCFPPRLARLLDSLIILN